MSDAVYETCRSSSAVSPSAPHEAIAPLSGLRAVQAILRKHLTGSVVSTVATSIGLFVLFAIQGVILARMLGPKARGEYGTVVLYTQSLLNIGLFGTLFSVNRRSVREPKARAALKRSALRVGGLTGLGTVVLVAALAVFALPHEKAFLWPLCIAAAAILPLEHMRLLLLSVDRGAGDFRSYNLNQLFTTAMFPTVLLIAWCAGCTSIWVVTGLTLAGPILGLLLRMRADRAKSLFSGEQRPPVGTLLKEGGPYVVSVASSDLFGKLDAMLFLWLASFTAQGFYAAAVPAASVLVAAPNALAMFAFNRGARGEQTDSVRRLVYAGAALVGFQIAAAAVLAVVLRPLMALIFGTAFAGAVPLAFALLPAQMVHGVGQVIDGYLRGRGNVRGGIIARCVGGVAMIVVSFLLHGRLHDLAIPVAASLAHLGVAIILGSVCLWDARRRRGEAQHLAAVGDVR
jgi:enterobacterial common antigen flippase